MRIALCSNEVAGLRGGGIGTYVTEAGKALQAAGHEVWLVTARPEHGADAFRRDPSFSRVLYLQDADTSDQAVRFGLARHALRAAQLAFDVLKQSGCLLYTSDAADE